MKIYVIYIKKAKYSEIENQKIKSCVTIDYVKLALFVTQLFECQSMQEKLQVAGSQYIFYLEETFGDKVGVKFKKCFIEE